MRFRPIVPVKREERRREEREEERRREKERNKEMSHVPRAHTHENKKEDHHHC
jgi:hypothetical protein